MPINKPPAFQFYPKDFLSDLNVQCMNMEARGIYITLLCNCWIENSIPDDPDIIQPLLNHGSTNDEHMMNQWKKISRCFYKKGGRLFHKRLESEREKQKKYKKLQSDKGKLSGIARQKSDEPRFNHGSTTVQPKPNSSVFGFQSSNKEKNILSGELKENIKTIVSYLNEKTGKSFRDNTDGTKKNITGRLSEDFTVEDFKKVIDKKTSQWLSDPKFEKFLRPETLFCKKHFESYLNEKVFSGGKKKSSDMTPEEYNEYQKKHIGGGRD